jgi:hypothetical protein
VCDPKTGSCEECLNDTQCGGSLYGPKCLGTSGQTSLLCGCTLNADCKDHPGGAYCEPLKNLCGCQGDGDCMTSIFGKKCVQLNDPDKGKIKQCGCSLDTDCKSGEKCLFNFCAQ